MIHITAQMRVLVAIEPVDGRKGIDSLVRVCQGQLCEDPMTGCVFVFRSRRGTSIRLLSYDGQGYRLAQKRLSKGRFTWWPESSSAAKQLEAYEAQLLKYLVWAEGRPIACLAWSSAPRHLGSRDRYIGWDAAARRNRIRFIAYNTRFLILPWVRVEHLASHILGRMAARISDDWEQMYGYPLYFLETFIDPERFRGTCYRAANWVLMGRTTGRGKQSNSYVPNRSIK
jgi:transposase